MNEKYARIYDVVRQIPSGCVATYGQIALLAGLPRQARMVGYALHNIPKNMELPWHRVVNAKGQISLSGEIGQNLQQAKLEAEGIVFHNGKIDLKKFLWNIE